jgi:hypothetical protein
MPPDESEIEFIEQLKRLGRIELIDFYLGLIATYSASPPKHRRNAIEITQRELEGRSGEFNC